MKMKFKCEAKLLFQTCIIFLFFSLSQAYIECYKCPLIPENRNDAYIDCPGFNGSDIFKVRCYTSTYCEKLITQLTIQNGTTIQTVVRRDCAPQNNKFHQLDKNGWKIMDRIEHYLYEPGCVPGIQKNSPTGPGTYCYCNTHYCNRVSSNSVQTFNIFMSALITSYLVL